MSVVYQHRRLDTNEVFYVGIGKKERAYDDYHLSSFWKSITNKTKYRVEIVIGEIDFEEAKEVEKYLIKYYGRRDLGLGSLTNMTDGGDGANGAIRSKETREKISLAQLGSKNHNYGKTITKEVKEKISKKLKGNKHLEGHIFTKESREKLSRAKVGNTNAKGNKGKPKSEEHKNKIAEAARKRWAKARRK